MALRLYTLVMKFNETYRLSRNIQKIGHSKRDAGRERERLRERQQKLAA